MDCAKTPTDHTKDRANSAGRLMASGQWSFRTQTLRSRDLD